MGARQHHRQAGEHLEDDEANYDACKLVQQLYGVRRCIVQLNDPDWKPKFEEIGGVVLDPDTLVVAPLTGSTTRAARSVS